MSTLDTGLTLIRTAAGRVSAVNGWMGNAFKSWMPTGICRPPSSRTLPR
jgi:two-component system osmolarity sensor histidine kinase EnvZ